MSATNFNTKNDTYRKLMGNGLTYSIPRFQRDYSWTEEEWEDLWLDILGTIKEGGEPAHYMGYLVLQSDNDKLFDVIDGQQRLTTMSIIVLAVLKNFQRLVDKENDPEKNKQRLEQIRQMYVGYLDPVTLVPRSKLTLNRNNDNYYQTYLIPLGHLPVRGFRASEHNLRKAFEWFDKRIEDYLRNISSDLGVALAQFIETVSDHLFFTVITVTDELNAYKVFETLNARGVRLSATDLLKNYLFSVLHRAGQHEHEMKALEDRWEAMVGRLGSESFPDFLRVHWNSRHSFVRQTELFKIIRGKVYTRDQVFALVRDMEEDLDTYLSLAQPEASQWTTNLKSFASDLRLFSVKQPTPLLMAARRKFSDSDFETIFRACVIISFRYNVIGNLPTNEQERIYNSAAERLSQNATPSIKHVLNELQAIYPSDDAFRVAFVEKIVRTSQSTRNKRVVRYILCALEKQASSTPYDFDSIAFNLEHILPENPDRGWEVFSEMEHEALVYRLGNMTLLNKDDNKNLGNSPYAQKKQVYERSIFAITRKIADENADWTPERLAARQAGMARSATAIWRVAQMS